MFVIKKLKLNKFVSRPIVSNRSLYKSLGERPATIESKCTSECYEEPTVEGATKTKILGLAKEIAERAIAKKMSNGASADLNINAKDA